MTNIEPFGSLVLIEKVEKSERKTTSGLVLTTATTDFELNRGKIIAVGTGDYDSSGNKHEIPLTYGDIVIYNEGNATEVVDNLNNKYYFVNWRNLLGKEGIN
jgi:co-chaperonin GroES (HSP10)